MEKEMLNDDDDDDDDIPFHLSFLYFSADKIPIPKSDKIPMHKWDNIPIPKSIQPKLKCPKNKPKVKYCLMNPCTIGPHSFCPLYPVATCYSYLCGGCYSKWFNSRGKEVFCSRR
ncbi:uncharacterized protein LOC128249893 isoform X1 [Octopus bimaculoides]|uniref:uncharacterized protein LOC128249893 isoform X1 n=1 Tax=Octopus bimaculoides TaxID=37653 RepID=UPI0022E0429A|nr:uncharacterized protein LOC128249893 isoform X1 [Octopus bimaculoides]